MKDDLMHPRRHLDLDGAHNIRDLGGYLTADGRRTRWGTFLRADGLHQLPPASQGTLIDYGVRTVVDLRLTRELNRQPDVFADRPEVKYHHENVLGDEYQEGDFPDLGEFAERPCRAPPVQPFPPPAPSLQPPHSRGCSKGGFRGRDRGWPGPTPACR